MTDKRRIGRYSDVKKAPTLSAAWLGWRARATRYCPSDNI
jgi:hypothetical protein